MSTSGIIMQRNHQRRGAGALRILLLATIAVFAASCLDDEVAEPPVVPDEGGALFERYVSLGNSITAGFQSGGINRLLQQDAYPAVLAEKAGATFGIPALALPGCPPPLAAPLSAERVSSVECAYRTLQTPPLVQNLAVPGHRMVDALMINGPGANFLNTLILGGLTQVDAMLAADPTLVSVWLGNNDVLAAALTGDTTALTPGSTFAIALDEVVTAVASTPAGAPGAEEVGAPPGGVILIGMADPMMVAPALQPGAYFWLVEASGEAPVPLAVDDNCAPGTAGGSRLVSFLVANPYLGGQADSVYVDCGAEAPFVLNAEEVNTIALRISGLNSLIEQAAEDHGWIYVDPTASFIGPALADPDLVRKCQGLATATTPAELQAAVEQTCPHPDAPNFFGAYFTFDGIHPSSAAHAVIADTLALRLNGRYGLALPTGS